MKKVRNIVKFPSTLVLICCTFYSQHGLAQTVVEKLLVVDTATDLRKELSAVNAPAAENAILGLWINGVDLQQEAFILNINQKRYIECSILQQGFVDTTQLSSLNQDNIQYCLVESNGFSNEIDTQKQLFKLNIPAQYMLKQNLSTKQRFIPDMPNLGGFINYNVYYQDGDYTKQFNASTDLNLFWKNMLFNSSHLFRKTYHDQQADDLDSSRLNTSLSFEFPEKMTTLKLGDNVSNYTGLNQSFYFGGLSFGTNFSRRPNFTYWNTPSVQGSALTQSTVDLMINGAQAYNAKVNPGQFNIDSNIGFSGLGDAQVIVKDILGNTTVQNISVFVDQRLLRPRLTDYNFSAGKLRYNYAYDDNDYREWFGSGYIRRGITPSTTLGATADYSKKLESAGLMWSQYLHKLGLLEVNSAYSHADDLGLEGYTVNTEFKRNTQNYSVGLRSQYYSSDFRMLGLDDYKINYLPQQENQIYVSKNQIPFINNLSLSYVERKYREDTAQQDQRIFNLRTSQSFAKRLFGSFGVSYDAENNDRASVDVMLSYNFDDSKHSATLSQHDDDETSLQFNKYSFENTGFDYTIGASRSHDVYSGNLSTTLKTNSGDLNLQYLQTDDQKYYSANYMGSLVWLGNRLDLSKYISNSFALIRVDGTPNVDIYSNGSYIGKTNKNGEIFSYNLYGYSENNVLFDESQISIEDSFAHSSRSIMPINQRGYIIDFPMSNAESFNLTFKFIDQNQQPLESGSIVNFKDIEQGKYPINSNHLVTIYGLTPRPYNIEVQTNKGMCSSNFNLNADTQVDEPPITLICQ
ncbi:fimbria/pilus outer membrane usher protein [Acinetobacter sp. ANC 4945]|uniref:Fimbrial biogenesis outer membrane usher protein n=1 Tax=Acinetobacter amyesii TaxID=2942470 RepID=A0A1T1H6C5_9GAMM|nr:fimbria/pilus outer membrane usher protein [Acinetobacter amyesii]MCL6248211.1 fimbria/pilus outer membrane usher protein [Acinetobacter amyesii]OOV85394.1 hypothetical protein B1202_01715 [Acinetobacter amyesii]